MKRLLPILFCLLPCVAQATKLTNCDGKTYDVTVVNGGQKRVVTLTPTNGEIEEFGPTVSFQIEGHPPVVITEQYDEYCIWKGSIDIQKINSGNAASGGFHVR